MCSENVAYNAGGAISVLGPETSALMVVESIFDANAVRVPMDGAGIDVTVRLNTGGFIIPNPVDGYHVPIWRVDDGPVFGIPWEQCQGALERSQEAVSQGFPASWPDLQCANVSYTGPGDTFNHVLSLTEGQHTLWTGLLAMVRKNFRGISCVDCTPQTLVVEQSGINILGWQQAWIEVVDSIGPLYPSVAET